MARAHIMRPIIGANGDLLYGATVTVREAGLSVKLGQPLYAGPTGSTQLSNPHVAENGVIDLWVDTPQRTSVYVQKEGHADSLVYLDAVPPPEETARTDSPLVIVGKQTPGNVLMAGSTPGQALWQQVPTNSGITPLVAVLSEDFQLARDPAGWSFTQAAASRDYPAAAPEAQGHTRSLHVAVSGNAASFAASSPGFTLQEPGFVSLWLRANLAASESVTLSITPQGGTKTVLQTLSVTRDWGFYRFPLAAGTYLSAMVEFTGAPTFAAGPGHEMWVTGIKATYGGQVPEHSHPGAGQDSILLGTGSEASGVDAVAMGAGVHASGTRSVAFGYQSQATGPDSVAVGPNAQAVADRALAVGARATGSLASVRWVAIGSDAYADADDSTVIGPGAKAYGASGTALGAGALVGSAAAGAVAVGKNAQALSPGSVALGANAYVDAEHQNSVAIGNGAETTASNQVVLGVADSTVRIDGDLNVARNAAFGTSPLSQVGFYGSPGMTKPAVTGNDGGNLALRNLINGLASLGLVTNSTTEG